MEELATHFTTFKIFATVFLILAACTILPFIYQIIHYRFIHPLKEFPGPFWATVTRIWAGYHNFRMDEIPITYAWLKKHNGPSLSLSLLPPF
jgi:hypothetical protein